MPQRPQQPPRTAAVRPATAQPTPPPVNNNAPPRTQRPARQVDRPQPVVTTPPATRSAPMTKSGFNPFKKKVVYKQEREAGANEWKCEKCGLVNANYVTTCACGYRRSNRRKRPDGQEAGYNNQAERPPVQQSTPPITLRNHPVQQPTTPPITLRNRPAQQPTTPPITLRNRPAQQPAIPGTHPYAQQPVAQPYAQPPYAQQPAAQPYAQPYGQQSAAQPYAQQPTAPAAQPYAQHPTAPAAQQPETPKASGGVKMDMNADWTCFRCNTLNAAYVTTCGCGVSKRRAARFYETGEDPYAAQEEEERKKQAERDKAMEAILEQKSSYGPKVFDNNVIVEVETVSRQGPLERKMTNMLYNMVDKAGSKASQAPEKEDRLGKYRQDSPAQETANVPPVSEKPAVPEKQPAAAATPLQQPNKPMYSREPYFDEWRCPDCGTINNDYVTNCSCGCSQRRAKRIAEGGSPDAPRTQLDPNRKAQANVASVNPPTRPTHAAAPVIPPPVPGQNVVSKFPLREVSTSPAKPSQPSAAPTPSTPSRATTSSPAGRPTKNNNREPYFDEWKCPECGTINNDYVTACSCGCTQRRAKRIQQQNKKK